jgi:hypothetical protein
MAKSVRRVSAEDRTALLREGIVVLESTVVRGRLRVEVAGAGEQRVYEMVARRLGDVDIELLHELPRRLRRLRCTGFMEREPGRLQLRYVLRGDEHVDDIVVAEDEHSVVALATVCTPVAGEAGEAYEGPWHVYLERPLGGRIVIDGATGDPIPYRNVYAELARGPAG